jgi:predicted DNA-binding transcriptional regulator YafY
VIVDGRAWGRADPPRRAPAHLDVVQRAVVEATVLRLDYVARDRTHSTREVHPFGLAAKSGTWYLVAGTENGLRTFRVDRIAAAEPTGAPVVRPADFDLAAAWRMIVDDVDRVRLPVQAQGLLDAEAAGLCRYIFGDRVSIGPPVADGRVEVTIRGHHVPSLSGELACLGGRIEITSPVEVQMALRSIGEAIVARYRDAAPDAGAVTRSSGSQGCAPGAHATSSNSSVE